MKVFEELDLTQPTGPHGPVIVGRHSIWLPQLGVKVPFQWGGSIQKYKHEHEKSYSLDLLGEEVALLRWLSSWRAAPPIGDWVYFKTVISEHPEGWWADPCGAYGYEMAPAEGLAPGDFDFDMFKNSQVVEGSPGAWNDLNKPGNVINGYLIDVHRSGWDRLRWLKAFEMPPVYEESWNPLMQDLREGGQFPPRERELPYQEVHGRGRWWAGEREVVIRAKRMLFKPAPSDTVVDIGSQLGGFLQYAKLSGARRAIGIEVNPEYVALSRRVLRAGRMNACVIGLNAEEEAEWLTAWVGRLCGIRDRTSPHPILLPPTHLLLLSMDKHFKKREETLWRLVDLLRADWTYLETNAVNERNPWPLKAGVEARRGDYVGDSMDRNQRRLYRIGR